jgi:pentatricopeptide repeat protein
MLLKTFSQMQQQKVTLASNSYRVLLQALGQVGDVESCREIWTKMLSEHFRPQPSVFIALLEAHLRQGQVNDALMVFNSLRDTIKGNNGSTSRHVDGTSLLEECRAEFIRGLCRISREQEATRVYLQAREDGALGSIDSATSMMLARMQADCGNLAHAWTTLEDVISLGHKPNEATLLSFLNACFKQSHTLYAKTLLEKACANNLSLSPAVYAQLLKLHTKCQQVQEALSVFEIMTEKQGIEPSPQIVVSLLRTCFQCRQAAKCFEIMENLEAKAKGVALDASIYVAALAGCASAGLVSQGISILEVAVAKGALLPEDSIEALALSAQRRLGCEREVKRLKEIAMNHKLNVPQSDAGTV